MQKLEEPKEDLIEPSPPVSIWSETLIVSPNRRYRGIWSPTTPAMTGPK